MLNIKVTSDEGRTPSFVTDIEKNYLLKCFNCIVIIDYDIIILGGRVMKSISSKDISLGFILVVLFVSTLVAGAFRWPFFIFSAILLFLYILLDKKKLRCPNCGGFENLDRLSYAKNHTHHCRHCGERIRVLK